MTFLLASAGDASGTLTEHLQRKEDIKEEDTIPEENPDAISELLAFADAAEEHAR